VSRSENVGRTECYSRGMGLYDRGLYAEAIAEFERVLKSVSQQDAPERKLASFYMGESYANLGLAHLRMRMYQRAEEELRFALVLHPEYADLNFHMGVVYYKQGKLEDAALSFEKAISINPGYAKAVLYLGLSRLQRHDPAGIANVREAAEMQPAYRDARYVRAMEMWEAGEPRQTILLIEDLVETDVDASARLQERGLEFLREGKYDEAAEVLSEAADMHPQYADIRNYLGQGYLGQGMVDLAMGQFQRALDINPSFVGARMNLAAAYEQGGRPEDARSELKRVLEIDPTNLEAEQRLLRLG